MAINPPYIRLSNGDVITFEKLGPYRTAVLLNSEGVLIRKGNKLIGSTEKEQANTIIFEFSNPKPTIVEEVLTPLPSTPPPVAPTTTPTQTPEKVEEERLQEAADDQVILNQQEDNNIDVSQIENATPDDLKAMGLAKLPLILLTIGNQVKKIIEPAIKNLITTYIQKYINTNSCPDAATLAKIRQQRDLIVNQLNKVGKTLNVITISLTGVSTFLNLLQSIITGIDLAKIAAKIAAASFPPLAAALPSLLNTLSSAKQSALIDEKGNSRLTKLNSIIGGAALVASIISGFILTAVTLLKSIDVFLEKCDPNNMKSLIPISKEIQDISNAQRQSSQTQNLTTYNGFIIEIQEVPYTPTVNRRRALGKNQQGIVLTQTELSFTTNNQTLISELKFIIDRDNLKAY